MLNDPVYLLTMLGTAVFALSGAMAAARQGLDIFGFIVIAMAPAVGGGTIRDVLLGNTPVFWIKDLNYFYISTVVAIIAFFQVHRLDGKRYSLLVWADAFGLALFTILGTEVAMARNIHPVMIVLMGMLTGTFGGILRDIICNEVPLLLQKEIYMIPAITGSLTYLVLLKLGMAQNPAMLISACATMAVRGPAIIFSWSLPPYRPNGKQE